METHCHALSLPQEAFDVIATHLSLAEVCALESTCKAWRQLGLLCTPSPISADATTPLKGRLDRDEKIDSFGFWLFKRGSRLQRLKYEHVDCERHNAIAFNVLDNVSTTLTSLNLIVSKYTKNRRGLPGPASFSWLPVFPKLTSLFLDLQWSVTEDWELLRWAPNLKELNLKSPARSDQGIALDLSRVFVLIGHPQRNKLPESLETFKAIGILVGLSDCLQYPWVNNLTSISIQYPTRVNEKNGQALWHQKGTATSTWVRRLCKLESLTDVALEVSTISLYDYNGSNSRQSYALRSLSSLKQLKTLKWAYTAVVEEIEDEEKSINIKFMKILFPKLERLHILGNLTGWQEAALQGACSQIKELMVVGGNAAYLPKEHCLPSLEHLIVDSTVIKKSIYRAQESYECAQERNAHMCDFAAYLPNLKKVTVLTSGHPAIFDPGEIVTWLRDLLRHTGNSVAVDIEDEFYLSFARSCLASEGVQVGEADFEISGSAAVWKKWEQDANNVAIMQMDEFDEY